MTPPPPRRRLQNKQTRCSPTLLGVIQRRRPPKYPLIRTSGGEDIVEIAAGMQPSTSRPILLAAGLPAGANISDRNKVRIWTDKYVDFYDIIHTDATHTYHMALTTDNSSVPSLQFSPRRRRPLTESEWCAAWDDYMAVYTLKHPTTLVDMITYAKSINKLLHSDTVSTTTCPTSGASSKIANTSIYVPDVASNTRCLNSAVTHAQQAARNNTAISQLVSQRRSTQKH